MIYLRDYLHDIPLRLLKRIAEKTGASAEYGARIKLLNAVDRVFWDGSLVRRMVDSMPEEMRQVLSLVAFSFDAGIPEAVLLRKAGLQAEQMGPILNELILSGLIGGFRRPEMRYFSPRGPAEQVRAIFSRGVVVPPEDHKAALPPASFPALLEDICSLAAAAYREPLPVTLKGHIRKTVLDRIFTGSPITNDTEGSSFSPHRDEFVTGYLVKRGLMEFDGRAAALTQAFGGWINLGTSDRMQDIASYALELYLTDDSAIVPFVGLFGELVPGTVLDPDGLARFFHERTPASYPFTSLSPRIHTVLACIRHLGAFAVVEGRYVMTETGCALFRGETLPLERAVSSSFTLQPNFEVLIGPELDPRIRFTLELMSTRKRRDIILTNMVEKSGIAKARERGMSVGDVLEFFERHSRSALPQNVRFSIATWAEAYGNVLFEPVMLMRFRNGNDCESVMHVPSIAPYIRERISETSVAIPADKVLAIASMLKDIGWFPEVSGESVCDPVRRGTVFRSMSVRSLAASRDLSPASKSFIIPEEHPKDDTPIDKDME